MDDELRAKIGFVAGKLVQEVMTTGLTWDEAVAAFGLAAKAAAQAAATAGDRNVDECVAFALRRLEEAFAQDVRVVVADPDVKEHKAETAENPLLATARRRQAARFH